MARQLGALRSAFGQTLAAALTARMEVTRRAATAAALAFRGERYRLFPDAADKEAALEITEGISIYAGGRLGLARDADRIAYALRNLDMFVSAPTFVRSFAYAPGPACGLLLNDARQEWLGDVRNPDFRFDVALGRAAGSPRVCQTFRRARRDMIRQAPCDRRSRQGEGTARTVGELQGAAC